MSSFIAKFYNFMTYDMIAPIKIHDFITDYFLARTLKTSMIIKPFSKNLMIYKAINKLVYKIAKPLLY